MFASSPKRAPDRTLTKVNRDRIDRDCLWRSHFAEFGRVGVKMKHIALLWSHEAAVRGVISIGSPSDHSGGMP
jgi:hypothetical protein